MSMELACGSRAAAAEKGLHCFWAGKYFPRSLAPLLLGWDLCYGTVR